MTARITGDRGQIEAFCRKHQVRRLALFGSVLRDDFGPESDVDVLVEFEADARLSLFEFVRMRDELAVLFGRDVDLIDRRGLRNPFRRRDILSAAETLYVRLRASNSS